MNKKTTLNPEWIYYQIGFWNSWGMTVFTLVKEKTSIYTAGWLICTAILLTLVIKTNKYANR